MARSESEAFEAMLSHHRSLEDDLGGRVTALVAGVSGGAPFAPAAAELVAYFGSEILPHALAEEQSIYRAAARRPELSATVAEMEDEHRILIAQAERIAQAATASEAVAAAGALSSLFAGHVAKENELILPKLLEDDHVDLTKLLEEMHQLLEHHEASAAAETTSPDALAAIVPLLVRAADELANAEQGDLACRLVASAWAVLRPERPELATRLTAALHRLVRKVTSEPVTLRGTKAGAGTEPPSVLDVRPLAPAKRHEAIFSRYVALAPGASFVLVNDHDPKPLQYQFEAEHAGEYTWEYLEAGPKVWQVRIGKPSLGAREDGEVAGPDLDVRPLTHGNRHAVIFSTYAALRPGAGFVLVNDHDPRPLRYQFEAQHAGEYTWDYLEAGPAIWRVRIGRVASPAA